MPALADPILDRLMEALRAAALRAADAAEAVRRHLRRDGNVLRVGQRRLDLSPASRVWLIALGKAAPAMAAAAAECAEPYLAGGIVTTLGETQSIHPRLSALAGGHPLPDSGSLAAGELARRLLAGARPDDLVLALVSGGGSAMFELLGEHVTLDDLRALNDRLIRSGAPIDKINTVRRSLSLVKGGGLARIAWPARTIGLILSDVVGDPLSAVASGPTVLQSTGRQEARRVLEEYGLWKDAPPSIRAALVASRVAWAKPAFALSPINLRIGGNREMVLAARAEAERRGFRTRLINGRMRGEAREVGSAFARRLIRAPAGSCYLMGGETTVTVRGAGRGGRNQELALAAARVLDGVPGAAVLAMASDGVDGPTDSAGAAVDGATLGRARELGLDPEVSLAKNDSYPLLLACGALLRTGATRTNVGDLVIGLRA
jgi:hydroxypyruvate reductase